LLQRLFSHTIIFTALALLLGLSLATPIASQAQDAPIILTLGAYTTPREIYGQIIPLFQAAWAADHDGQQVIFQESYLGSGAQSRAVAGGFEADVVALSLERDVTRLVDAGLITHDWQDDDYNGMISASIVAFAVRAGNPKNIQDWADLAQPGVEVLTPDPATSGGAQWNILAAYGAAARGHVEGYEATDEGGQQFLRALFTNVSVMDAGARESFVNFERGVGDVAITYENEVYTGQAAGGEEELIRPTSTILIENPIAVVDTYVDKHGTREAAEAFVAFTHTPEVQLIFAQGGYRPVSPEILEAEGNEDLAANFPAVEDLFTIEDLGGWAEAGPAFFGDEGVFTKLIAEIQG
jgi:sulfate/thiosulfate transport system substrate-binding protein